MTLDTIFYSSLCSFVGLFIVFLFIIHYGGKIDRKRRARKPITYSQVPMVEYQFILYNKKTLAVTGTQKIKAAHCHEAMKLADTIADTLGFNWRDITPVQ